MMASHGFRGFHHVWLLGRTTKPGVLCMLPILDMTLLLSILDRLMRISGWFA